MKNIIFSVAAACLAFCACDRTVIDGELNFGLADKLTISVVKNNASFSPDGGDGFIIVKSESAFTASSNRDWCTLKAENDSIAVSVEPYDGSNSRFSSVVVKNEAGDSVTVSVHQAGVIIQSINLDGAYCNNAGGNVIVTYSANLTPKLSSDVDWAVPSVVEEGINIAFSENASGSFRKGSVSCVLGPKTYEIPVAQLDSTEILGIKNWELDGVIAPGDTMKFTGTITRKMTGYGVKLVATDISWTYDAMVSGNKFGIPLGTSIGRYKPAATNYYVIPVVAEGTSPINAGDGIDSGYFYIPLDKESADSNWQGKVENANLRFEFWALASRPAASEGGFRFKDVILKSL